MSSIMDKHFAALDKKNSKLQNQQQSNFPVTLIIKIGTQLP